MEKRELLVQEMLTIMQMTEPRDAIENWVKAVCWMEEDLIWRCVEDIKVLGLDSPGPHWRVMEFFAYQWCLDNLSTRLPPAYGMREWTDAGFEDRLRRLPFGPEAVRGAVLYATLTNSPFFTSEDTNG